MFSVGTYPGLFRYCNNETRLNAVVYVNFITEHLLSSAIFRFLTTRCTGTGYVAFLFLVFMLDPGTMEFKEIKAYTLVTNVLFLLECHELDN